MQNRQLGVTLITLLFGLLIIAAAVFFGSAEFSSWPDFSALSPWARAGLIAVVVLYLFREWRSYRFQLDCIESELRLQNRSLRGILKLLERRGPREG